MTGNDHTRLVNAVKRALDKDDRENIVNHGIDAGFSPFIYTNDCARFFRRHRDAIWEMAVDETEQLGHANVAEFIGTFRRSDMLSWYEGFENLMCWYAVESICRRLVEGWGE